MEISSTRICKQVSTNHCPTIRSETARFTSIVLRSTWRVRWIGLMHYMQSTCSVVSRRRFKAAWIHHAFTQIHPFSDGSGRVARAIASLVFIRGGSFPLVVYRDDRADYIGALEIAGAGNLRDMIGLSYVYNGGACLLVFTRSRMSCPWGWGPAKHCRSRARSCARCFVPQR